MADQSVVASIDVVRCLRNRRAYEFLTKSGVPISASGGLALLVPAFNKAWAMSPDATNHLTTDQITPYLPAERSEDKDAEAQALLRATDTIYETEKAIRIAYTLVATRKLSLAIDQTFQENSTPFELEKALKKNFTELAQLEVLSRRQSGEDDDNQIIIHPTTNPLVLRPPHGGSRIVAGVGGDLDIALGGGLDEGTYSILLGSKGEGKTWVACAIAAHNAKIGKNVLFITLENSKYSISDRVTPLYLEMPFFMSSYRAFKDTLIKQRTDIITPEVIEAVIALSVPLGSPLVKTWSDDLMSRISKLQFPMLKLDAINELVDPFYEASQLLFDHRKNQRTGTIDIRFFPANSLRPSDIETILEASNIKYHLIIVDYLNAVQVPGTSARHEHLGWFSDELRRFAGQYKCAAWLNAQLKRGFKIFSKAQNKGGLDEEVFFEFIAESFKAVWGADYVQVLMSGGLVDQDSKKGYSAYDRTIFLNRAREVTSGVWFGFKMHMSSGTTEIKKLSL